MTATVPITGTPGEIYEQHMVPAIFAHWAADLVDAARVQPGHRVLDVACGTGAVTRVLADRVGPAGRVTGLDLNPVMLAAARVAAARPNIEWLEGSAVSIPLPAARFDAAVCQQGLQFFPDKVAALREMRRVLAPGGCLALSCWQGIERQTAFLALEQALARRIGPDKARLPPFGLGDRETLRAHLAAAGFADVRIRAEVRTSRFPSVEGYVRAIVGGAPSMLGALTEQGPQALDEIVAEMQPALAAWMDDEGLAFPLANHIATAVV